MPGQQSCQVSKAARSAELPGQQSCQVDSIPVHVHFMCGCRGVRCSQPCFHNHFKFSMNSAPDANG